MTGNASFFKIILKQNIFILKLFYIITSKFFDGLNKTLQKPEPARGHKLRISNLDNII